MRECRSPFVIEMYDWYEDPNMIALVLEYPQPSQTLWEFLTSRCTPLSESTARPLMYQAVQAVQHCLDHGVFHSDVHLGNFLLDRVNMKLTLINFAVGNLLTDDGYDSKGFKGALQCTPPEAHAKSKYYAMQTNVWALGVLLYCMVHKRYPYKKKATKSHKLRLNKKHFSKCE
ncbi:serine/threonine-protein kinase pim-2-like isoform X1 [Misgurnus anguillicaudatus]|uniref:serine/threonine-protein kinase pim-2-like isoform X1 n=2 Tax=Misgurnus anguillicaudatus TaxID=75329 RepID=UPI003CCF2161